MLPADIDLRVGGCLRVRLRSVDGTEHESRVEYLEVVKTKLAIDELALGSSTRTMTIQSTTSTLYGRGGEIFLAVCGWLNVTGRRTALAIGRSVMSLRSDGSLARPHVACRAPLWLGLTPLRARWSNTCPRSVCGKLIDEVGHESGPSGLVRSTAPTAIVTVKILVEEYVVLEMLVGL